MNETRFQLPNDGPVAPRRKFEELLTRRLVTALASLEPVAMAASAAEEVIVTVEAGIVYPAALLATSIVAPCFTDEWASILPTTAVDLSAARVVDRYGHTRPVYRPLLVYSLTQTFALLESGPALANSLRWRPMLDAWQAAMTARANELIWQDWPATASRGAEFAEAAWIALALQSLRNVCGFVDASDWADGVMQRLVWAQQPNGAFLKALASDNPETAGYHELLILHATGSSAAQTSNAHLLNAARRSAAFHAAEMQPDHATNQPWALFAFLLDPATFPFADGLITTAATQQGDADPSAITLMLMADALYCLQRVRGP